MASLAELDLTTEEQAFLDRFHFDLASFATLRDRLRGGDFGPEANRLTAPVSAPSPGDVESWPKGGSNAASRAEDMGQTALEKGQVGVVILNGGMATRFGGVVKGVVEVVSDVSFLGLKLRDVGSTRGQPTVFLMNSFATDADTAKHLESHDHFGLPPKRIHSVTQRISLRLTPDGEIFRGKDGAPSFYAPGHGDLLDVVARSPGFDAFVNGGGKYLLVSNVDNLGATLSARVIGSHIASGRGVTVEVAAKAPGDKGGAPAKVDDRVAIIEGFRFPEDFDQDSIPVFNTNTMVINTEVLQKDFPLTWFRADKEVEGKPVVQFERLMGEVTSFVDTHYLEVPREGAEGRFMPVKTPDDLETLRPSIRERLAHIV